jgi:hypothetical protein
VALSYKDSEGVLYFGTNVIKNGKWNNIIGGVSTETGDLKWAINYTGNYLNYMQHLKISAVNTLIVVIDSNKVQLFTDTNGVIT